jgi:hypothetical protein
MHEDESAHKDDSAHGHEAAVLVFDRDGLAWAFPRLKDAADSMDSMNALDGEYEAAFTLDGHVVTITGIRNGPVSLQVTADRDDIGLHDLLARSKEQMGLDSDVDDPASVANELIRREWERRAPHLPGWLRRHLYGDQPPQV